MMIWVLPVAGNQAILEDLLATHEPALPLLRDPRSNTVPAKYSLAPKTLLILMILVVIQ